MSDAVVPVERDTDATTPEWITRASNDALVSEALEILSEECKDMSSAGVHLLRQYVYAAGAERAVKIAEIHKGARKSIDAERQKVIEYLASGNSVSVPPVVDRDTIRLTMLTVPTYPMTTYIDRAADAVVAALNGAKK